jgi:hypothetical protein
MSKNRSKRNTKEALKKLKAKRARVKYNGGGYRGNQAFGYTPPSGSTIEEIPVYARRPSSTDLNLGFGDVYGQGQGMSTTNIFSYDDLFGSERTTSNGAGGGSGSTGDGSGYGDRNRAPTEPESKEKTPEEQHQELVDMGLATGPFKPADLDIAKPTDIELDIAPPTATNPDGSDFNTSSAPAAATDNGRTNSWRSIFGQKDTKEDSDEADATGDGTLEGGGGDGGGGDGSDEVATPPIKPIVEEEEPTTSSNNTFNTTSGDQSVSTDGTKQVQGRLEPSDLEGLTFNQRNAKLKEYGIAEKPLPDSLRTYGEQYNTSAEKRQPTYYGRADEPPTAGQVIWDNVKGVAIDVVTGAVLGAFVADAMGLSKTMMAKFFAGEALDESVSARLTGFLLDQGEKVPYLGPVIEGVRDLPATTGNFLGDLLGGAPANFNSPTAPIQFGYDPTGAISIGTGDGTVSESSGTASSGTVVGSVVDSSTNPITDVESKAEDLEVTEDGTGSNTDSNTDSTTYDNSELGQVLNGLNLGGTNGDDGMALNEITDDVTDLANTLDPIEYSTTVDKTDKTLVTAEDDIQELGTMTTATAPKVGATTLKPVVAAKAATVNQMKEPVKAQTVNTVSADQVKQQKAAEAFNQTPEVAAFKEASAAHMAKPERAALARAYEDAGASGDEEFITKAEADLKAFDSDFIAQAQTLESKQREFMSTYGDAKAVTGEISEGSTAVSTDATMSTEATVADRNTAAEQAALAQNVGFDVSTKSTVDPVTGEKIIVAATPAAEAAQRDAITDDTFTPMEAAQITETLGYETTKTRAVKGEAAIGAASEMLAEVGDLPPAITAAIVEDPEKVEAQLDNQPVEVRAAIAALPKEALMSSQMENLLGSLEENKVPAWARPAVDATNAMLAKRGLSSSTIGRDSLFNAIIQSALPIAENNANALQKRAAQNLDNEQQANITTATLDMNRRLANLANQQTAVSQTAQMANEMKKLQSSFTQEAVISTAAQEQQVRVQNLENRQRTAEQNNRNRQETMALNLGNEQQMTLANLEFQAASDRDNMTADNQRKLAEMNVAAEFLSKNAELKNSMDIANMSTESQMKLANLKAQNDASSDNLTATQQTELANLEATLKTNLTQADIASNMGVAQLNADQQRAVVNAQTNANIDLAKFDAASQVELVNSKFAQTMTMNEFDAKNTAILQNATNQASMDLSNADNRTKVSVQNASNFLQMDLSNMSNEQQVEILGSQQEQQILLADTAAANATAQFNAESVAQTDQFMATLGAQIDQYNATAVSSMAKFNVEQENKINAENAGNTLKASIANATLASDTEQFNLNMANQRDQWNASNAQTIQQGDLTWRRNANTADTAAINDANRQNVANAFAMSQQKQAQVWQELKDEATYANNNYENNQNRIIQIVTASMAADTSYAASGKSPAMSLTETLAAVGLGAEQSNNN